MFLTLSTPGFVKNIIYPLRYSFVVGIETELMSNFVYSSKAGEMQVAEKYMEIISQIKLSCAYLLQMMPDISFSTEASFI